MFQPLYVAATGLESLEEEIANITDNLANSKTVAFKKSRTELESLYYVQKSFSEELEQAMSQGESQNYINQSMPIEFGTGVRVAATTKDFTQGSVEITNRPYDLAIQGEGLLQFSMPDGSFAYGRAGNLHVDNDGNLVNADGNYLEPRISIPADATQVTVQSNGTVLVRINNEVDTSEIGQVTLARFSNPAGLESKGQNLYAATASSGEPIIGYAGDEGYGNIAQYSLEKSNVDVISEMMRMVMVQRVFDIVAKAVQSYEAMLTAVGNMKQT